MDPKQPPTTFNFGLALNFLFIYRTLSMRQKTKNHLTHTQMGSFSAKNAIEKFSR